MVRVTRRDLSKGRTDTAKGKTKGHDKVTTMQQTKREKIKF